MIIYKKCSCGNNSIGNTTIRCCNLCGLPLPTEPWHFNLPDNIFSPVEPEVGKTERDIWNKAIEAVTDHLEKNAQKINQLMIDDREALSTETLEHFRFDKEFCRNLSASIKQKLLK